MADVADYHRRNRREPADGGETVSRPHKAFRLADELVGTVAPPDEAEVVDGSAPTRRSSSAGIGNEYAVLSITPEGEGETVSVVLAEPDPDGGKPRRIKLYLLVEQYADLGVKVGRISIERFDLLVEAGKLCAAIRRGMGLLQYGDKSARRLAYKLNAKGIDRETATAAAAYLSEKGYIREDDTARLRAEQGVRKGWGLRRICEDLRAQGFTADAVEDAVEALSEVDFTENCAAVIRKKYGDVPEERPARQKMVAALMRLGYDSEEIREAMRMLLRKK